MKKIVLLSDGTGNGAAKRHKTNVWRLYDALDLQRGDQIAMYDDGVGSREFLLFKLLGGAFGWGLKRNVLELYKYLCRNYDRGGRGRPPDRIYLFGFSRGAFTVRILAGLLDKCGLCKDFESERDLHRKAQANYAIYREAYGGFRLSRLFPRIRYRTLTKDRSRLASAVWARVEFIGVWDTVDAYGLPFDELTRLVDRFVFPLRFPNSRLSERVRKACHAVSIDDERKTFHPVLWDESGEHGRERIEQVWFPGVHSDVGGGYPRHRLALVSLDWMISKVEATVGNPGGLVFLANPREDFRRRGDRNGVQHDSRAGLRAYYRYMPRNIDKLCREAGATVGGNNPPKIHRSAFERIRENVVPYAPTGLPARYEIVSTEGSAGPFETDDEKDRRFAAMDLALRFINWRRWLYRAFLVTTLSLVASPLYLDSDVGPPGSGLSVSTDEMCGLLECVFPDFALRRAAALYRNPQWVALMGSLLVILSVLKRFAARLTAEKASSAWSALKRDR